MVTITQNTEGSQFDQQHPVMAGYHAGLTTPNTSNDAGRLAHCKLALYFTLRRCSCSMLLFKTTYPWRWPW
jgi:hypothetical protein